MLYNIYDYLIGFSKWFCQLRTFAIVLICKVSNYYIPIMYSKRPQIKMLRLNTDSNNIFDCNGMVFPTPHISTMQLYKLISNEALEKTQKEDVCDIFNYTIRTLLTVIWYQLHFYKTSLHNMPP